MNLIKLIENTVRDVLKEEKRLLYKTHRGEIYEKD